MEWKTTRRETMLVEYVCEHNVGHPAYGSALWIAEVQAREDLGIEGPFLEATGDDRYTNLVEEHEWGNRAHGCDGCCKRDDFPGTYRGSLTVAHRMIRDKNDEIKVQSDCIGQLCEKLDEHERPWWEKLMLRVGWGG